MRPNPTSRSNQRKALWTVRALLLFPISLPSSQNNTLITIFRIGQISHTSVEEFNFENLVGISDVTTNSLRRNGSSLPNAADSTDKDMLNWTTTQNKPDPATTRKH